MSEGAIKKDTIIQIGIRVKDLDASAAEWQKFLGVKPVVGVTADYEETHAVFRGKPCFGKIKQALFDLGNTQIELIAPLDEDINGWSEGMEEAGEGLHHLAFKTPDMEKALKELRDEGYDVIQTGDWKGDCPGSYAYVDAKGSLKTIIELLAF